MNTQYRKFKGDLSLKEIKNKNLLDSRDLAFEKLQEEIEYEQHCNEQLRNKIINLEYKIKRLEEDNKYKIDKIKKYVLEVSQETLNNGRVFYNGTPAQTILELLEEIE